MDASPVVYPPFARLTTAARGRVPEHRPRSGVIGIAPARC